MFLIIIIQSFILPVQSLDLDANFEPMQQYCIFRITGFGEGLKQMMK